MRLTLLMLLVSAATCAQQYSIPHSKLTPVADLSAFQANKMDVIGANFDAEAKIIFTGVAAGDYGKIALKLPVSGTVIPEETNLNDGTKIYILVEHFKVNIPSYEIFYNGASLGTVKFTIENYDKLKGDEPPSEDDSEIKGFIGALASANFIGNNKFLSNLTPVVNLGGIITLKENEKKWFSWQLDVNPYIGGEIDTKDSVSFLPALMLYGRGGFVVNNYLNLKGKKLHVTIMPIGFGLKFIPNLQDSSLTVIQHNLRAGISLRYADDFLFSGHITHAWHNLTSESKANYSKIFSNGTTDIDYVTVAAQMALRGQKEDITNYIYLEWRSFLSKKRYASFTNTAILTLGLRKTLELGGSGGFRQANTKGKKRKVHHNL